MANTTKTCPHCRSTINALATKCPHCQSDVRSWGSKHKAGLALLGCIALFIIIISAATNGGGSSTPTQQPISTPTGGDWQSLVVGDDSFLRIPGITDSNQNICLGKTTKDAEAVSQALLAKDYVGLLEIPGAFCVGNGSKVKLIEKDFPYRKVRILAGVKEVDKDKVGLFGYVPAEWVVSK
jgi:hypothetical protein